MEFRGLVLVFDDDQGLTKLIERTLLCIGFAVECVFTQSGAFEKIESNEVDLLLLD